MPTYTQIGSAVSVGVLGASSIDFTSIPSTFTDLVLRLSVRTLRVGTDVDDEIYIEFNGSGGTAYSARMIEGNGATARSVADSSQAKLTRGTAPTDDATASTFSNTDYYIPNYAGSTNKSVSYDTVMENNATTSKALLVAGLWSNTAAITSIKITGLGTFVQYSTAYLYGVSNA